MIPKATLFCLVFGLSLCMAAEPATRWDDAALSGAGSPPPAYEMVPAFGKGFRLNGSHLTIPYRTAQGDPWHLVLGRNGEVWSLPDTISAGDQPELAFQLRDHLKANPLGPLPANGVAPTLLLGGILDREWPKRPWLYLSCNQKIAPEPRCFILKLKVEGDAPLRVVGEPEVIFSWESNGHNGSDLHWGPGDGFLYVSAGDGSSPGDPRNIGQQVSQVRGSILRFDVHGTPDSGLQYAVPKDNPFVGIDGVCPEIWCYGLRNPWRMGFHPETHELWIGDNGDESWELIHRIKRGSNSGWSAFEGSHPFRPANSLGGPTKVHTPPRIEHPHNEMRSVIGGVFYRGKDFPDLRDHYIYGCYVTQEIWAVSYDSEKDLLGKSFRIARSTGPLVAIREDHEQEILFTSLNGNIERLQKRAELPPMRPWPKKLSDTGLFSDVTRHQAAPGVYEYLVNAEGWADGASRRRFVAIPRSAPLIAHGAARLYKSLFMEQGGAYVQTAFLDGKPIETQILYNGGSWKGYTYQWDELGKDAALVPAEGFDSEIAISNGGTQKWHYPSRSECLICHSQRSMYAIAFTPSQLDRNGIDGKTNQLDLWVSNGLLRKTANLTGRRKAKTADPYDPESGTLEERSRAYLDVNCAHCHRETGLGGRASFQLMSHLRLSRTGLINAPPMIGMLGKADAKVIAPGHPELSELLGRVKIRGPGQMPLIGSFKVDQKGCELLRQWIESMPEKDSKKSE